MKLSKDLSVVIDFYGKKASLYNRRLRKRYHINSSALKIVLLLQKGMDVDELIGIIAQRSDVDTQLTVSKVTDMLTKLENEGVLVSNPNESVVIRKSRTNPALKSIQFEITRRCNLRCKHCYLEDYSGMEEMDITEVFDLIDQAAYIGVESFSITGGEPMLRTDLKEVIQRIYEKGMYSVLYTNGTMMDSEFILFLKDIGINAVKISLDGFNPKTHDEFRKAKDGFSKAINTINQLKNAGIPVEVGSVITKANLTEAHELVDFLKNKLKVKYHIDSFVPIGQGIPNISELAISDEEYISVMKNEISDLLKKETNKQKSRGSSFFCGAGNSYVFINCGGLVKFCPSIPDQLNGGSLREHSLEEIWLTGGIFQEYRNVNCRYFDTCLHAKNCKGGCRSRSLLKYGGMAEPDIQMCKMFYAITGIKSPAL